jgi:hypothetical protein
MLFREIIAVCCENHTEHTQVHSVGRMQRFSMLRQVVLNSDHWALNG